MTGQELRTGPHNDAPRLHEVGRNLRDINNT